MQNTAIVQGQFTSTGAAVILAIPMGVDWIEVRNDTKWGETGAAAGALTPIRSYWQVGMANGTGEVEYKTASANTIEGNEFLFGGFTAVQNPLLVNGVLTNVTSAFTTGATAFTITAATPPVLTVTGTPTTLFNNLNGLNVLRLTSIVTAAGSLLEGIDFTFDTLTAGASMTANLTNMTSDSAVTVGTQATIFGVTTQPYFYPSTRLVCNISQATRAVVTTTVTAPYVEGQQVRFIYPKKLPTGFSWGMSQINNLIGTVVAVTPAVAGVSAATFTVDIDTTGFTAFNKPGAAGASISTSGVQWVQVVPVGDVAAQIIDVGGNPIPTNVFTEAQFNQGYIGIQLGVGGTGSGAAGTVDLTGPAGVAESVIFWKAGKSFSNTVGLDVVPPLPPLG